MKIVVIGATGTIGESVTSALISRGHIVVPVSRSGIRQVDLTRPDTVDALFAAVPDVDAVVCCAASGGLTAIDAGTDEEFTQGLHGKLLGQVLLVRHAIAHLRGGGSIILTAGTFREPIPGSAFGVLTNAGLEAFVQPSRPNCHGGCESTRSALAGSARHCSPWADHPRMALQSWTWPRPTSMRWRTAPSTDAH